MHEKNSNSEEIAKFSRTIRERSLLRIDSIPNGFRNWRMKNTALSFAHIIQHSINVDLLFLKMIQSEPKHYTWILGADEVHFEADEDRYYKIIILIKELQTE
jgi:hypothetical protein